VNQSTAGTPSKLSSESYQLGRPPPPTVTGAGTGRIVVAVITALLRITMKAKGLRMKK
jgi:hypothetical protein